MVACGVGCGSDRGVNVDGAAGGAGGYRSVLEAYACGLAGSAAGALILDDVGHAVVVHFDCLIGAGVVAEVAALQAIRQALILGDLGDADYVGLGGCVRRQAQGLGGAGLDAQGHAVVGLGAEVAVLDVFHVAGAAGGEYQLGRAHANQSVLHMGGTNDVVRADGVALLAADAGGEETVLVLATGGTKQAGLGDEL